MAVVTAMLIVQGTWALHGVTALVVARITVLARAQQITMWTP
jgi:hypothetical protein